MNSYTFHINLFDLSFLGAIFTGLSFALLLWFANTANRSANRFLSLTLIITILMMARLLFLDIGLSTYFPHWDQVPMQFQLAIGPLLYFYVLKTTDPGYKRGKKDLLHFSPLLAEQSAWILEIAEGKRLGISAYATPAFDQISPLLLLITSISILIYLWRSHKLIQNLYSQTQPVRMERSRLRFRWLRYLLVAAALLCMLWLIYAGTGYLIYRNQLIHRAYPFYIFFVIIVIWIAAAALLKSQVVVTGQTSAPVMPGIPVEWRTKGAWLKRVMETGHYYQDPDLTLSSLAEKISIQPHELSKLINTTFKKGFNGFINEYRVMDAARKMQDPAYDNITLLGIGFEAGFNSKTSFNRIFKQMTGKSPTEYKNYIENKRPTYNLGQYPRPELLILNREPLKNWVPEKLNSRYMFKNYFKTTIRSFWKNKGYSFLNIAGLAVGIACAGLIFLWVEDEVNWDSVHTKKDRLYFVRENQKFDAYTGTFGSTPGLLGPAMQAEIPGIANTCRVSEGDMPLLFVIADKSIYASGKFAEPSLFSMFTLPFVQGNAAGAFNQLYSIVITEKTAKKFFGNERYVIGKTVRVSNKHDYVVSGVLKDIPENSSLQFEWVAPFEIYFQVSDWLHKWGNNSLSTYVELKQGTDASSVNKLLYNFIQQKDPQNVARPFLFSMNDWHLRDKFDNGVQTGGGRTEYVHLFSIVAWIILLIACINFMNLSTARSEKRAREVGVRKVLGAGKVNLIFQFIGEALLLAFAAAILAIIIMALTLPTFNLLVEKTLSLALGNSLHIITLTAITLVCGLFAGSYPALYLSSFNAVFVLKGVKLKTGSAEFIRKGLVVLQFTVSIILIISTIIVYQQIQHVKSRNLGFNKNNLLQTDVVGDVARNYNAIKHDLLKTGMINNVALSDHATIYGGNNTGGLTWEGKSTTAQILISQRYVSTEFFKTSGIQILEGRDIAETDSAIVNKTINIVITQSLEKLMGKGSAIGKSMHFEGDNSGVHAQVVGVVNDYVYGDMYGKPDPVMFFYGKPENTSEMYMRFGLQADIEKALTAVQTILKKYNPVYPFTYQFVDDQFNQLFLSEALISKLSSVFAALAIIISCLGLFGLSAYTAERRTKEIGVRKALGASVVRITTLLSTDFLKLVVVSCIIAFPVAWWVMHNWLQGYEYRIIISWWIFLMAGISAMLIALITISFQSIKAAWANPVKSLRTE